MGSGSGGLYSGTYGSPRISGGAKAPSKRAMRSAAMSYAEQEAKRTAAVSQRERKRFQAVCVAVDLETGERYVGRNGWGRSSTEKKNPYLFGDGKTKGILPPDSMTHNKIPVGNCAEVDAVNQALNAGAKISNLYIATFNTRVDSFGTDKRACKNCTYTFKNRVAGNHTGWEE